MDDLYENINALCHKNGITISKLCKELGLYRSLFTDLKQGRKQSVNVGVLQKVAAYFGISVNELMGEEVADSLQSLRDVDRVLLQVARNMTEEEVQAMTNFARMLKGDK